MTDDKKNDSDDGANNDATDLQGRRDGNEIGDMSLSSVSSFGNIVDLAPRSGYSKYSENGLSLADRLSESLLGGDCDLLLHQREMESSFLQWLQALDRQVIALGACRVDERMKPLLKANPSGGVAEDRLLTYLSEHFEAAEIGLIARCLCIPLVSIRVGKVIKHGTTLCPTSSRGNLNVALLPSSDLRITFVGDDGRMERITTVNGVSEISLVAVEEILADTSSRSFLIRVPDAEVFYFWLSEKSNLLGKELLSKMKDLLRRKPTLASLTGISELRLDCFATHLCTYILGSNSISTVSSTTTSSTILLDAIADAYQPGQSSSSSLASEKSSRYHQDGFQSSKMHSSYQGSLGPRSNSFKEGHTKSLSSLRNASKEKLKPRFGAMNLSTSSSGTESNPREKGNKFTEVTGSNSVSGLTFLESLRTVSLPSILSAASKQPPSDSLFSPYYCWRPPCTSPSSMPLHVEVLPLSVPSTPPLNLADVPPLEFPSSLLSKQSSQQIPTFTSLMCEPIVHIPVIDVCSSGQGYLVSAGPTAIATSIPSMMIPKSESVVEKGARETLRLLLSSNSSSQPNSSLIGILPLPAVLNASDKLSMFVAGSRGLYSGSSIAAVNLVSLSESTVSVMDRHNQVTSEDGIEGSSVGDNNTTFWYEEEAD